MGFMAGSRALSVAPAVLGCLRTSVYQSLMPWKYPDSRSHILSKIPNDAAQLHIISTASSDTIGESVLVVWLSKSPRATMRDRIAGGNGLVAVRLA